jgi:hypothetical protein
MEGEVSPYGWKQGQQVQEAHGREREPEMTVPYENATGGQAARDEISKILRRFGCESVGFMDDYQNHEILLAFVHRGRPVQLRASAKGWAALYLREHPYSYSRSRKSKAEHEQAALVQGSKAINSILRDWVKGQVTAVECGILSFEAVFMPYMLTSDGTPLYQRPDLIERIMERPALSAPEQHP